MGSVGHKAAVLGAAGAPGVHWNNPGNHRSSSMSVFPFQNIFSVFVKEHPELNGGTLYIAYEIPQVFVMLCNNLLFISF